MNYEYAYLYPPDDDEYIKPICTLHKCVRVDGKYTIEKHYFTDMTLLQALNELGSNQWEVVSFNQVDNIFLLKHAYEETQETVKRTRKVTPNFDAEIEQVYDAYPARCPVTDRITQKNSNCKTKIARLLADRDYTYGQLIEIIADYVSECKKRSIYIKNFMTFLNNIPDHADMKSPDSGW